MSVSLVCGLPHLGQPYPPGGGGGAGNAGGGGCTLSSLRDHKNARTITRKITIEKITPK